MLALVTCAEALGLDTDLALLTAHLDADVVVWDDPLVEWGNYDAVAWPSNEVPDDCADYPPATVDSADLSFEGCSTLDPDEHFEDVERSRSGMVQEICWCAGRTRAGSSPAERRPCRCGSAILERCSQRLASMWLRTIWPLGCIQPGLR